MLVVLFGVTVQGSGVAGASSGVVDQRASDFGGGCFAMGRPYLNAQTFTAGITGSLDQVDIMVRTVADSTDVNVEIRNVDAGGAPGSVVLGSGIRSIGHAFGFVSIAITPTAHVTAGVQYALVASSSESEWCISTSGSYSGGAAMFQNATVSTVWSSHPFDDFTFMTYVVRDAVTRASPTITTQASAGGPLGTSVNDVATVAGGANPTGTVAFKLFSDASCTTQVFASTGNLAGGTATSGSYTPAAPGTYHWTAAYSGDANNAPVASLCGAANESVVITPFEAPPPTSTFTGDVVGPITVRAGQSVHISGARVVGPVTVGPGGALTIVSSTVTRGITANAPSFFSICGTDVSGSAPATTLSVTNAAVPIRVGDPATGCAGNRFAGQVVLSSNRAVTFGANAVSHTATLNNNGPGNTVVKANTVFGTLACAGNNPPPTNVGQPNTAGAKTGQCTGL